MVIHHPLSAAPAPVQPAIALVRRAGSYVPTPSDDIPGWSIAHGSMSIFVVRGTAPALLKQLSSFTQNAPPTEFCFVENAVLAGFQRLCSFRTWNDNWDAEGSRAPNPAVVDAATKVYSLLASHAVPNVQLSPDGYPMFLYDDGKLEGEIAVIATDRLEYYFTGDGPSDEDVAFTGDALPVELISHLTLHA